MAFIFIDGFDTYNGPSNLETGMASKWGGDGMGSPTPLPAGRFGGQCFGRTGGAGTGNATRSFAAVATVGMGFARRGFVIPATPYAYLQLRGGGLIHINVNIGSGGVVTVTNGLSGAVLATSAAGVYDLTWQYWEVSCTVSDTVGAVKVTINGTVVINATNVDTRNGVSTTIDTIIFNTGSGVATQIDDMYVLDTFATLGERRVDTLYAAADTVEKDFVPNAGVTNYTQVDETLVNGDTDYVQGSVVGDLDLYEMTNLAVNPATIDAVQISAFMKKTDAAARAVALQAKSGATQQDGTPFNLGASYTKHERIMTADPNGGGAWTKAAVDALQVGPKVTT